MRKVILYIATSLDNFIARRDGSIDWLPQGNDYGYNDFIAGIDTVIMGNTTYKQVLTFGDFPYKDKENYVITRNRSLQQDDNVKFLCSADIVPFIRDLKKKNGKDIWLVGGGHANTLLLEAGLIDEMMLFRMPVTLGQGICLFEGCTKQVHWQLKQFRTYMDGTLELRYVPET